MRSYGLVLLILLLSIPLGVLCQPWDREPYGPEEEYEEEWERHQLIKHLMILLMLISSALATAEAAKRRKASSKVKEAEAASTPSKHVLRCPNCGCEVYGDYRYCPNCGARLSLKEV